MKKTKVLVTGCFDVLHSEHIEFLKVAKKAGDILLVGVESDERVTTLKGPNRPVNSLATRLKNLSDLNVADKVFALPKKFSQPADHETLINQIMPDIMAISSHTPNQPAKKRILEKCGGRIKVVLKQNPKVSSSKIIKTK